jgi:hypothetical protein
MYLISWEEGGTRLGGDLEKKHHVIKGHPRILREIKHLSKKKLGTHKINN